MARFVRRSSEEPLGDAPRGPDGFAGWLTTWVERALPQAGWSAEDDRLARLVAAGAWVTAALMLLLAGARFGLGREGSAVPLLLLAAAAAFAALPLLLRVPRGPQVAGLAMPSLALGTLVCMSLIDGGMSSDAWIWVPFVPLLAAYFSPGRGAIPFIVLGHLGMGVVLVMHPEDVTATLRLCAMSGALVFSGVVGWRFERARQLAWEHRRFERLKDEFLTTVGHELRTPITSVAGALRLLRSAPLDAVQASMLVDVGERNILRLERLVERLLDVQRLEHEPTAMSPARVALDAVLGACVDQHGEAASRAGVSLRVSARAHSWVELDANALARVLDELVGNAIKFSPRGAEVHVLLTTIATGVRISVVDRAGGIPKEFEGSLYERFSRADAATTRVTGGMGVGLTLARLLCDAMGLTLAHESDEGRGSVFWIDIPDKQEASAVRRVPIRAAR